MIAIFYLPKPPQSNLENKSASYVLGFTEGYQKKQKSLNIIYSIIGFVIFVSIGLLMIGGWRWLEQRLMYCELMQRERQKREEESAQLDFLSALGVAA